MTEQISLFDYMLEPKKITKPIRLIELFAGIGSQLKALKQVTPNVEHYKICEWAYPSICAYNAIHIKDFKSYSAGMSKDELIHAVEGISINYNSALTIEQLKKKPLEWLKNAYNNIRATNNLVDIMRVHGKDLEIRERERFEYILTYSFPCQDLSLAGRLGGMSTSQANGGTRSGLLWEVDRILGELKQDELPQILIMENVPQILNKKNIADFHRWQERLEKLGYRNYVEVLNAKDYGIPQNRRRCFMVSLLGDSSFKWPREIKLEYRLKNFLDEEVDKKYFLSEKMLRYIVSVNDKYSESQQPAKVNKTIASCITTKVERRCDVSTYVAPDLPDEIDLRQIGELDIKGHDCIKRVYDEDGLAPTIVTSSGGNHEPKIAIKNATKQGYLLAEEGDGIDIATRKGHRGTVQKGIAQTIKTEIDVGVAVKLIGGIGEKKSNGGTQYYEQNRIYDSEELATAIPAESSFHPWYGNGLLVRKLTPRECYRLMGFEKKDHDAVEAYGQADGLRYHEAGDSIVVTVLMAIFNQMINEDQSHEEIIRKYTQGLAVRRLEQSGGTVK